MMVPVIVESVRMNLSNGQRVVILKDDKLERYLLIWVGIPESAAIALELQNEKAPRPLTADLLRTVIEELGAHVVDISVVDLQDNVFFARVGLMNAQNERVEIDARPSDAIALAVRTGAPVFVDEDILEEASVSLTNDEEDQDEGLEVYRDFVEQLFQQEFGSGEGERRPDA